MSNVNMHSISNLIFGLFIIIFLWKAIYFELDCSLQQLPDIAVVSSVHMLMHFSQSKLFV